MITACYTPVVNGVTRMVALYAKHLVAAGHQVTIFTLGQPAEAENDSVVVRSPGLPLGSTGYHVAARYSQAAQRRLQTVDILHCHHLLMGLEFAGRYGDGPIVFTNHTRYDLYLSSYGHLPTWLAHAAMGTIWRRMTKCADVIVAPSVSMQDLLRKSGVEVPIEVIENGIEVERFRRPSYRLSRKDLDIPADAIVTIYVGRVTPEKNIEQLMEEFELAATTKGELYLLVVGEGPNLKKAGQTAARQGLADRIKFVGQVEPAAVPAYLAVSDAFISASISEVHPLAVIESLAAGVPVIAIDSPGMRDAVVHEESGLLVAAHGGSLAQALLTLANSHTLRHQLAAGARLAGNQFAIEKTIKRTLSLYRRLIKQRDGPIAAEGATKQTSRQTHPTAQVSH